MKASPTLAKSFVENAAWGEVSTLIRIALVAGFQTNLPGSNQLYVPEIVHIVTLVAGLGSTIVRKSVYGIIMNLLQSLVVGRSEEGHSPELLQLIEEFCQQETIKLFGLLRPTPTSEYTNFDPVNDRANMDNQEKLAQLMGRMLEVTAGNQGNTPFQPGKLLAEYVSRAAKCMACAMDGFSDCLCLPILLYHPDALVYCIGKSSDYWR
jgi:neurofibromin 1